MKLIKLALFAVVGVVIAVAAGLLPMLNGAPKASLHIVSGSENKALEPIIARWGKDNKVDVKITYQGSVDIARALSQGTATEFDAVWPANSLWIELGDSEKVVKHDKSVLRSPVVLGLRKSIAQRLGWIGRDDITIAMIKKATEEGAFRLSMTSATQSNSGASAYFGFLYALSGNPDLLTLEHLSDPQAQERVRGLLAQVDRSSGSSGWLKDSLVGNPNAFDAMFNYEALVIEANQALQAAGQEPLYVIYPADGLAVADSPLGYVSKGHTEKEAAFLELQKHLESAQTQELLIKLGRRAGLIGLLAENSDPTIWNPEWGIDLKRQIAPIPTPGSEVIAEALRLYQTELRKPSLTVWVLDVSGSMQGEPLRQLQSAMGLLLNPDAAAVNLLQPSSRDVSIVIPFNHKTQRATKVEGNTPSDLADALARVNSLTADGGTDLYGALNTALQELKPYADDGTLFTYLPAIVALTDGASSTDNREPFLAALRRSGFGADVPIHSIAFGKADKGQLEELSNATIGRVFTAKDDLGGTLRKAKGYN